MMDQEQVCQGQVGQTNTSVALGAGQLKRGRRVVGALRAWRTEAMSQSKYNVTTNFHVLSDIICWIG